MVGGGWETISNISKATPTWIGEPDEEQIAVLLLEEEVVQQFHSDPGAGGGRRVDWELGAAVFKRGFAGGG
jgi:hypothetical protein